MSIRIMGVIKPSGSSKRSMDRCLIQPARSLEAAANKLHELRDRFKDIAIDDHSRTFNTELTSALELSFMLDVSSAIVAAALARTRTLEFLDRYLARGEKS